MRLSSFIRYISLILLTLPLFTNATSLDVGGNHSCTLTSAGGVKCWGDNESGQLGDGTTVQRLTPVMVSGLSNGVAAIAAGASHTCVLTTVGAVKCWGANTGGQLGDGTTMQRLAPTDVISLSSGVQAIAAGNSHTCALTTAGAVKCWGNNAGGQLGDDTTSQRLTPVDVFSLSSNVQAIAAGGAYTCALITTGSVQCWGGNGYGQLGDGTTTNRLIPVAVSGLGSGVQTITSGNQHSCALTMANSVKCWGHNSVGQLGDGTTTQRLTPVAVSGLGSGVKAIAVGAYHTCALTLAGAVQCWGWNYAGQLGDGTTTNRLLPIAVSGLSSGVQIVDAGNSHSCALKTTGDVKCWGNNAVNQLGDGTTTGRFTPVTLSLLGQEIIVTSAAPAIGTVGIGFPVAAISSSGLPVTITATGGCSLSGNTVTLTSVAPFCTVTYSQIGNSEYLTATAFSITSVDSDGDGAPNSSDGDDDNDGVLDIFDAMSLDASDSLDADFDGIGNTADTDDDNDTMPDDSDNCSSAANLNQLDSNANGIGDACEPPVIAAGSYHTCALTTVGGVQCWGWNGSGQLGNGSAIDSLTPVAVSGLNSGVQTIAMGYAHSCALTTAGSVQCWGQNTYGQLGDGTTTQRLKPVAVSGLSSGVRAITASSEHTCVILMTGGVKCWGWNNSGELGDGTTTQRLTPVAVSGLSNGVQAIDAGWGHTCALTTAGSVQCWGKNQYGQLGDGTTTNRLIPVAVSGLSTGALDVSSGGNAAPRGHSCALTITGVKCWGRNDAGQLGDGTRTDRWTPVTANGLGGDVSVKVVSGSSNSCVLTMAGGVKCWGSKFPTNTINLTAITVDGLSVDVQAITAGYYHNCVLMTSGKVQCWGINNFGQLGDGATTDRSTSVDVLRDSDGDGVLDASDAFPYNAAESVDTDHDGIGNNVDLDDDNDGVPDYIDADPLNAVVNTERLLPLNSCFKGSSIQESAAQL